MAVKTEGFVLQDLVDLANRAIFESYRAADLNNQSPTLDDVGNNFNNPTITFEHCTTALQAVSDISLQHVNLFSSGERDFSDIGGLDEVKSTLIENLVWPLQVGFFLEFEWIHLRLCYSRSFPNCSGIRRCVSSLACCYMACQVQVRQF